MGRQALVTALAGLVLLAGLARAEEAPILRVETGMHSGAITAIAADPAGQVVLTGALDGTARLWDARSGALRRTLRPPIDSQPGDGDLFAVSVSSDGRTAAIGGFTRYFDQAYSLGSSVYLFDLASGAMLRRLPGTASATGYSQADRVLDLRLFSVGRLGPRLLVAKSLAGAGLYRSDSGQRLDDQGAALPPLAGVTVDVDAAGRMALATSDGVLRLYDAQQRLLKEGRLPPGAQPQRLRFSPDGALLAVLSDPEPLERQAPPSQITLLRTADLTVHRTLPWPAAPGRSALAWLPGTGRLCASGAQDERPLLRCWEGGKERDLSAQVGAGGAVRALWGLPGAALAYGTEEPAWGVLEADGRRRLLQRAACTDLGRAGALTAAQRQGALRLSEHGEVIEWPLAAGGPRARYAVAQGLLTLVKAADEALRPALLHPPGKAQRPPQDEADPPRALAYRPDGDGYLAGWEGSLRGFNRDGLQRFRTVTPAPVQALVVSGDSRLVVAALADGTLRWYQARSGELLLTVLVPPDGRRFIAFTPGGLYDASVGGEGLGGWHLNPDSVREARFVPLAQLRTSYYRPSRVAAALGEGNVAPPIAPAQRGEDPRLPPPPDGRHQGSLASRLPPQVRLVAQAGAAVTRVGREVQFQVTVTPPAPLRVLLDGRELRGVQVAATRSTVAAQAVRVPLPPGVGAVPALIVVAQGSEGAGDPLEVTLPPPPEPLEEERPRLWLLGVGVSRYARPGLAMTPGLASSDASELADTLLKQRGLLYREVQARVLVDAEATRDKVLDGLEWLARQATARDVVVVQLAGHGVNDPETGQYYFLPHDADPEHLLRTGVAGPTLQSALAAVPGRVVLLLDTCHAGSAVGRGSGDFTRFVNELSGAERGVVVMTSALGRQLAQESPRWGHGAFTLALLEGLHGKADFRGTGRITLAALDLYVSDRVRELTGGAQTPVLARPITVPDFPLVTLAGDRPR